MDRQILYPLYRDNLFAKAKRLADYEKLKHHYQLVNEMIDKLSEKIDYQQIPRNPRQDILQRCDKNNVRILLRQKQRLEEKMLYLEGIIREDIDESIPK